MSRPSLFWTIQAIALALLATSCATSKRASTTQEEDDARLRLNAQSVSPEECQRRAKAMAVQERDMRSGPMEVVDTSAPNRRAAQWNDQNNPCPEQNGGIVAPADGDSTMLRTQIDIALDDNSPERARRILPSMYTSTNRGGQDLEELTERVSTAYLPSRIEAHKRSGKITHLDEREVVCTATSSAQPNIESVEDVTDIVRGSTVHLSCGLPKRARQVESSALILRMREGTGRYRVVTALNTGNLSTLPDEQDIVQVSISLDDTFLAETQQAYMEAYLMDSDRPADISKSLAKGSFFWFSTPAL